MDSAQCPQILVEASGETAPKPVSRWRWWLHLCVLTVFPLAAGVMGYMHRDDTAALLPKTVGGLLKVSGVELAFFGAVFATAWLASRANAGQLLLKWRGGPLPVLLGFALSIALRLAIMLLLIVVVVAWMLVQGVHSPSLEGLRPQIEHLVDVTALARNPLYCALCVTFVSFVVAGLREELWRAGMLAGLRALFPRQFATLPGRAAAVVLVALVFGLGHTAQGLGGVGVATLLGVGLGIIMLWRRSIWEAVIAHGFFDAATFAFLFFLARYFPGLLRGL